MIDENAFGLLIAYLSIEDDEYSGERADFLRRFAEFGELCRARLAEAPPGRGRVLELGHALYVELLEEERSAELIAWLKETRARLTDREFRTAGILTFGASWREEGLAAAVADELGPLLLTRASGPSEPLRRALAADTAARGGEEEGSGWGPGLYLDVEAVEALGRKPKNAPTVLSAGSATFYRAGS